MFLKISLIKAKEYHWSQVDVKEVTEEDDYRRVYKVVVYFCIIFKILICLGKVALESSLKNKWTIFTSSIIFSL